MSKNFLFLMATALVIGLAVYFFSQYKTDGKDQNSQIQQERMIGEESTTTTDESSRYITYSKSNYDTNVSKKRVLFFHAVWCPTCKIANEEFNSNLERIPEGVALIKTDYDKETELKKKYNITYQHTFVLVDDEGNEIKKWNGGGIEELINNAE